MENDIIKFDTPELKVIDKSKADQITKTFEPMTEMLAGFEKAYNELVVDADKEITPEITQRAKRLRLDIGRVRIETGKLKDKQKEYIKLEDKAIMGVHNILVWAVKEKEDNLKDIERHFELQEQKRLEALQLERVEKLSVYIEDAHERDLAKFADDEFEALLSMKKKEQEDRVAAEQKAEEDRIAKEKAEAEERERIAAENEKLRKEAEARDKAAKIEEEKRSKEEAKRKAKEEADRKEREKFEAEEKEKREKLEAKLKAKEEAERKEKEEAAAKLQAELSKGDADKVKDLISDLKILKTKYSFKSAKNTKMYSDVCGLIDKVVGHIEK